MKKRSLKTVLLLTLTALQIATAVDFSSISVRAYEDELLSEEVSDAESSVEIPDEIPEEELIEEEQNEQAEELLEDEEVSEASQEPSAEASEEASQEASQEASEESSEEASEAASEAASEESPEDAETENTEEALDVEEAGEVIEELFRNEDEETADLLEAEKQMNELLASGQDVYEGSCGKNLTYTLNVTEQTLRISGTGAMTSYSRSNLAPWYKNARVSYAGQMKFLQNIIIDEGVTSVGNYAFINMPNVRKIVFPKSLKSIGTGAFQGDRRLVAIGFMGDIPTIGTKAFEDSDIVAFYYKGAKGFTKKNKKKIESRFRSVTFKMLEDTQDNKCGDNLTWAYDADTKTLTIQGQGAMRNYSFIQKTPWYMYSDEIKNVVMESGITSVGSYAFYDMELESLNLPDTLNYIGDSAFENTTVDAFGGAVFLKNVTYVGKKAFASATVDLLSYDGALHLDSVQTIGDAAFSLCKMSREGSLVLSDELKTIPLYAFKGCKKITGTLVLPSNLEYIGIGAFMGCGGINGSLNISDTVTDIGEYAFYGTAITDVSTGDGIKQIRPSCFGAYLVTMRVGKNVDYIDYHGIDSDDLKELYFFGHRPALQYQSVYIDYTKDLVIYYPADDPTWDGIDSGYFTVNGYTFILKKNTTEYTVKFNITYPSGTEAKDKNSLEPVAANKGDCLSLPEVKEFVKVKNEFYYFNGWYLDSKFTKIYDKRTIVDGNMTLYGKYEKDPDRKLYWGDVSEEIRNYMKFNTPADIPDGFWCYTKGLDTPASYTGSPIRPSGFALFFGKSRLFVNTDYTCSYKNNVKVGTATLTVKFIKNLSGEINYNYKIVPVDICFTGRDKFYTYTDRTEFSYTGKVQKPQAYLKMINCMGTFTLKEGRDYTVIYPGTNKKDKKTYNKNAFKAPGKYRITIKGKGNYTGQLYCNIEIKKKTSLKKVKSSLPKKIASQNAQRAIYEYGLSYKGRKLIENVDYTVSDEINLEKGYVKLTYEALSTGDFSGILVKKAKLKGPSLSKAVVYTLPDDEILIFKNSSDRDKYKKACKKALTLGNGTPLEKAPQPINGLIKVEGPYVKKGKKYIKITGKQYSSTVFIGKKELKISGPTIDDVKLLFKGKLQYDGFNLNLGDAVAVTIKGEVISSDMYEIYVYRNSYGKYLINVTGENGLTGSKDFDIPVDCIEKYDISTDYNIYLYGKGSEDKTKRTNIEISNSGYDKKKGGFTYYPRNVKPSVSVTIEKKSTGSIRTLHGAELAVSYQNCDKVGTAKMIIEGKGWYCGTVEYEYTIIPLENGAIKGMGKDILYQDKAGIYKTTFSVEYATTTLKAGVDYDVENAIYMYGDDTTVKRINSKGKTTNVKVEYGDPINSGDIIPAYTRLLIKVPLIGNYTGYCYADYYVIKENKDISKATVEYKNHYVYDGTTKVLATKDFVVKLNGTILESDDFYILKNRNLYQAGTYDVILKGYGSKGYTGTKTVKVTVGRMKVK